MKKNRGVNDQVQTAVSVRLWIADIILAGNYVYIILLFKSISEHIYVRRERSDDSDTGNIRYIFFYAFNG